MLAVLCLCAIAFGTSLVASEQTPAPNSESKVSWCNVNGRWRNELGSEMQITADGPEVRGTYHTAVKSEHGAAGPSRTVIGFVGEGSQPTIAFSVLWVNGSCTSWVGQCFVLPGGDQVLKTLWLLRSVAESSLDNWERTRVGADDFRRETSSNGAELVCTVPSGPLGVTGCT